MPSRAGGGLRSPGAARRRLKELGSLLAVVAVGIAGDGLAGDSVCGTAAMAGDTPWLVAGATGAGEDTTASGAVVDAAIRFAGIAGEAFARSRVAGFLALAASSRGAADAVTAAPGTDAAMKSTAARTSPSDNDKLPPFMGMPAAVPLSALV